MNAGSFLLVRCDGRLHKCLLLPYELINLYLDKLCLLGWSFFQQICVVFAFGVVVALSVAKVAVNVLFFRRYHKLRTAKYDIIISFVYRFLWGSTRIQLLLVDGEQKATFLSWQILPKSTLVISS